MDQERNHGAVNGPDAETPEAARIRQQIEATRAQVSGTIGELQDRLRPQHLAQQAGDAVREAVTSRVQSVVDSATDTGRRVVAKTRRSARQLSSQVQARPGVAAGAVAGLAGVACLVAMRRDSASDWDDDAPMYRESNAVAQVLPSLLAGAAGYYALSQVTQRYPQATRLGQQAKATAASAAGQVTDTLRRMGGAARTQAQQGSGKMSERTEQMGQAAGQWMDENPLMLGVAAFALGALAGMSMPQTPMARRALGKARSTLMNAAGRAVDSVAG